VVPSPPSSSKLTTLTGSSEARGSARGLKITPIGMLDCSRTAPSTGKAVEVARAKRGDGTMEGPPTTVYSEAGLGGTAPTMG
jgi:hypothetical protein